MQLQALKDTLSRQVKSLQAERASSEAMADQLKQEVQKKLDEINSLRTKNGILAIERDNFKTDSERMKTRSVDLKNEVDQVRGDLEHARDAARESRTDRDLVKMELDGVRRSYKEICEEVASLKREYGPVSSDAGSWAEGSVLSGSDLGESEVDGVSSEHAHKQRRHLTMERAAR